MLLPVRNTFLLSLYKCFQLYAKGVQWYNIPHLRDEVKYTALGMHYAAQGPPTLPEIAHGAHGRCIFPFPITCEVT